MKLYTVRQVAQKHRRTMNIYTHCSGKMEDNAVEIANSIF